ncbi:NADPH-dependent FMN reductase [Aureimonas leprariae]|uniref:NAD(P)H-dependent oxidoreductase n=1 Tax=Plantimonas leprariae TaxID=2615207 RepID=A0A7V7PT95_9HYPH|nr:NAD(P)H-dependent oxidoreductase [Aureimonas leprariae]KAB0682924.1 NAD(P)H-dependent oxidoreductase [Aureimonas leprariae]
MSPRILVLPGTLESASPDHALAFEAARLLAGTSATVTLVGLADYPLPLIDVASGEDPPEAAVRLAGRIAASDALLLVSPDANGSVPPLLKNAVDWIARVRRAGSRPIQPFRGLVVALASASPGRSGGFRALDGWRPIFRDLGAEVIGRQATVDGAAGLEGAYEMLELFVADLADKAQALGRHRY